MVIIVKQIKQVRINEEMLREYWDGDPVLLEDIIRRFNDLEDVSDLFDSSNAEQLRLFCERIHAQAVPDEDDFDFDLERASA